MRSIWKGAVSFGLVNVPVKLYAATQDHDIRFHQVHRDDGGRIRYKRTCDSCGKEVSYADIAKGYETTDGKLVTLTQEDFDSLPVATGHEIDVVEFVPAGEVDPMLLDKSYYLEPDGRAAKPYALLREALLETERMAIVKVALRQRETLAVLRVRGKAIVLQTMLWPDEIRKPAFDILDAEVELRPQEVQMASSLVDSLASDFDAEQFEDEYKAALERLIETKVAGGDVSDLAPKDTGRDDAEVVDLMTALQRSVQRAQESRQAAASKADAPAKKPAAKKSPAKKAPAAKKATAKKPAAKKSTTKKAAARKSA
jgi:DNA end-binding protein Ku